jgi:branched-chain amino acid transport system ATP-binding protein
MSSLKINNLNVTINGSHILQGVSFDVPENQVTALLGRNGVGKSTTLKAIMSLHSGTGSITLAEKELIGLPTHKVALLGIGYVPEDREIFSSLTVKENLAIAERDEVPNYELVYSLFPELLSRSTQRAGTLSGGQQQMVAIARSLLNKNRILIVDEPTKGLAPKLVSEVADALARATNQSTMLLVEQNLALVKAIAQNIVVMDQGKIVFSGSPENLQDENFVKTMLGVSGGIHK